MWLERDYSPTSRAAAFFSGLGLVTSQLALNVVDNGRSLNPKTSTLNI
jgi:NCS1 family nucleobase:cation symporter-1